MDAATTEQYKAADTSAGASKEEQPAVEGGASPQAVEEGEAKSSRSNGRASKSPRASKSKKKSQYAVGKESTPTVLGPELVKLTNPNSPPAIPTAPAEASPGALEAPDSEPNPESEAQEGGVKTPEAQEPNTSSTASSPAQDASVVVSTSATADPTGKMAPVPADDDSEPASGQDSAALAERATEEASPEPTAKKTSANGVNSNGHKDADPPAAKPQEQGKSPGSVAKPSTPKRWTPPKKSQPAEVKAEFVPKPVQSEAPTHINPPQDLKYTPGKDVLAYEELKVMRAESGVDMTRKEDYLSPEEFEKVFGGKSRETFKQLPKWRQVLAKKEVGLF